MDVRRSGRLVTKRGDALVKVIDVHDDDDDGDDDEFGEVGVLEVVEEEEEWEPGRGRKSARKKSVERRTKRGEKGTGVTSIKQGEEDGKLTEVSRSGKRGLENGTKTSPIDAMEALSHGLRSVGLSSAENGHSRDAGISRNGLKSRAQDEAKSCHGVMSCLENRVGNSHGSEIVLNAVAQEFVVVGPSKDGIMERGIQEDWVDLSSSGSSDDGGEGYDDTEEQNAREQECGDPIPNGEQAAMLAKVTKVLQEGGELKNLKADQLKAYLRHHRLRLAGLKAVLLSRVEDHLKFKDGQAEVSYPRASFSINCKGDVCLGDVVLFLQNVYEQHSYTSFRRRGKPEGTRWVAGKVVNESYGVDKQQHTFTIEVVWSTGLRPCYCMQPLLIKGRNLYRKNIMRLRWTDEAERQKVLDEKHARGANARAQRAVRASSSRGRSRCRATSRSDSNTREQGEESRISRPAIPPSQNSVQHDRTRTQQTNVHRGSTVAHSHTRNRPAESDRIPPPVQSSMQHGWAHTEQQLGRAHTEQQLGRAHSGQQHRRADHSEQQHGRAHSGQQHRRADHSEQQHGRAAHTEQQHGRAAHTEQQHGRAAHTEQQHGRAAHTEQQHGRAHSGQQHGRAQTEQYGRGTYAENRVYRTNTGAQGPFSRTCSTDGCENLSANHCILRSCGRCCYKNGSIRGSCPRHQ